MVRLLGLALAVATSFTPVASAGAVAIEFSPSPRTPKPARRLTGGSLTGVVLAVRGPAKATDDSDAPADDRRSLLAALPAAIDGRPVDRVTVVLPSAVVRDALVEVAPDGWTLSREEDAIALAGPPRGRGRPVTFRIGLGPAALPAAARVVAWSGDVRLLDENVAIEHRPPPEPRTATGGLVLLPGTITAGDTIEFEPLDPDVTPDGGTWALQGGTDVVDAEAIDGPGGHERYRVRVPDTWAAGTDLSFVYRDWWDETVVRTEPGRWSLAPAPASAIGRLASATPRSFRGRPICVCGVFPPGARSGVIIGHAEPAPPITASRTALYARVPDAAALGEQDVRVPGAEGSATIDVLQLAGEIDQDALLRGESTSFRLQVLGTTDRLELHLTNHTPAIISLAGGQDQVVRTSGGGQNVYVGSVRGVHPGDFQLTYELAEARCPCADDTAQDKGGTGVTTAPAREAPETESHYDDATGAFHRGRELADDARYLDLDRKERDRRRRAAIEELDRARKSLEEAQRDGEVSQTVYNMLSRYLSKYEQQAWAIRDDGTMPPSERDDRTDESRDRDHPHVRLTYAAFAPTQGVWEGDRRFLDFKGKQLTRVAATSLDAELDMVVGRPALLFGIRGDRRTIVFRGTSTATAAVPVKVRFTLEQGGARRLIYEEPAASHVLPLDGPAGPERKWEVKLPAPAGLPRRKTFSLPHAGAYVIKAELLRADGTPTGLSASLRGQAVVTKPPRLAVVPVAVSAASARAPAPLERAAKRIAQAVERHLPGLYPVRPASIRASAQPLQDLQAVLTASARELGRHPGITPAGARAIGASRAAARLVQRLTTAGTLSGQDKILAVLADADVRRLLSHAAITEAWTESAHVVFVRTGASVETVAHELIHTEPFAWSSPEMKRRFGFSYHNSDDHKYGSGVSIAPGGARAVHTQVHAVMGSADAGDIWITQGSYWHLLERYKAAPDPRLILVRGLLTRVGDQVIGELDPSYQIVGEPEPTGQASGAFAIVVEDAAGGEIARYPFAPEWHVPDVNVERRVVSFAYRIPDDERTASLVLVGPAGEELARQRRSAAAPRVDLVDPVDGAVARLDDGRVHVRWRGSDPDGDPLLYTVLFSADDGESWRTVAYEQRAAEADVAVRNRPRAARVRVIATDGSRSVQVEAAFTFAR